MTNKSEIYFEIYDDDNSFALFLSKDLDSGYYLLELYNYNEEKYDSIVCFSSNFMADIFAKFLAKYDETFKGNYNIDNNYYIDIELFSENTIYLSIKTKEINIEVPYYIYIKDKELFYKNLKYAINRFYILERYGMKEFNKE